MHTLSSTLLAAQKAASGVPSVRAILADRLGGVTRLAWQRLYTGTEPDNFHAGALSGGGALLRARTSPADYNLYYQRVSAPGPGSNFATWQNMGAVSAVSGLALATRSSTVLLLHVGVNQRDVVFRESADDGVTFGAAQLISDPGSITDWLAADFNASGIPALFFVAGNTVYWTKRVGGAWSTPQAWPYSLTGFAGLACRYIEGDWCLIVCAQDAGGAPQAWSCIFGDGGAQVAETWSPLRGIIAATAGSSVTYRTPALAKPDLPRAIFMEKYTGAGAYKRALATHERPGAAFAANLWREPVPFDLSVEHGPALAAGASYAWLTTPAGVWRAPLAATTADVSADLLEAEAEEGPRVSRLRLVLDNAKGLYAPGATAALRLGAEVSLAWGYRTAVGEEFAPAQRYWVRSFERRVHKGRSVAVLEATNPWGMLEAARVRRQRTWPAGASTVSQILADLFTMLGLELAVIGGSVPLQTLQPAFTVLPNESLAAAVQRLLALVPDALRFNDGKGEIVYPQATDASVYAYGTDHLLLEASDLSALAGVNRVQVYGTGALGESFLWPEVEAVADRLDQVIDANLTTSTQVQDRAAAELRRRAVLQRQAEATAPVNCGQQLYDVVAVTEPALGWTAKLYRVLAMRTRYVRTGDSAAYRQQMALGGV